jgi:heme exporter protein C
MRKTGIQLTNPPRLYQLCGRVAPWLGGASALVLIAGWVWGFGFAPADYQQGESYRIIYLHVPAAMWSMGIYALMAAAAFIGVVWQMKMANLALAAMAPVGAVFTFVALVTGSAWGKPMWGTWWVWDARLTSELVLLFLYVGAIALWHAFDDRRLAGRAAAILVLIGVVNLPIVHYSVVVEHPASGLNEYAAKHRSGDARAAAAGDYRLPAAVYHAGADAHAESDFAHGKTSPVGQ